MLTYATYAGELATRARNTFKDRAKLLRKLIEEEEGIYTLKIDLAVAGVRRRRAEAAQVHPLTYADRC